MSKSPVFLGSEMLYPCLQSSDNEKIPMEMVFGSIAAMSLAWWVGKANRLSDVQTIVMLCCAGVGCCMTGLAYLWIADIICGQSASPMWFVTGLIGGAMGIVVYWISTYLDWFVDTLKRNGML